MPPRASTTVVGPLERGWLDQRDRVARQHTLIGKGLHNRREAGQRRTHGDRSNTLRLCGGVDGMFGWRIDAAPDPGDPAGPLEICQAGVHVLTRERGGQLGGRYAARMLGDHHRHPAGQTRRLIVTRGLPSLGHHPRDQRVTIGLGQLL